MGFGFIATAVYSKSPPSNCRSTRGHFPDTLKCVSIRHIVKGRLSLPAICLSQRLRLYHGVNHIQDTSTVYHSELGFHYENRNRYTVSSSLSIDRLDATHAYVYYTYGLQYLNKLVEGKVRDFASPEPFHAIKVQRFNGDGIKPLTEFRRKLANGKSLR